MSETYCFYSFDFLKHKMCYLFKKLISIKNKKNCPFPLQNRGLRIYYRLVKRQISKQINAAGYSMFLIEYFSPRHSKEKSSPRYSLRPREGFWRFSLKSVRSPQKPRDGVIRGFGDTSRVRFLKQLFQILFSPQMASPGLGFF